MPGLPAALASHVRAFREELAAPRARLRYAVIALTSVLALLLARGGTTSARAGAAGAFVALTAALVGLSARARRRSVVPGEVLDDVVRPAAPAEADRARRALTLLEATDGTSRELAELHVARAFAAIPEARVVGRARRLGLRFRIAAGLLAAAALGACAQNPWGLVEGADVLAARGGRAPVDLVWLAQPEIAARAPDYLHRGERQEPFGEELELPRGTLLSFRGTPVHGGRRLAMTDGKVEVPFVDDGTGAVVARWPLSETAALRVVARFGDVVIEEPASTRVTSIPDAAPVVTLEGAPRTISLARDADSTEIPIRYHVEDDHGLREVHLVLRAGAREERRVLSRLDGETRTDRGGHVLRPTDPFFKRSHVPVEVRVAAKDNDPITGPKWGESEALTVLPPDVGEPEAMRLDALRAVRRAYVDVLAYRLGHGEAGQPAVDAARLRELSGKAAERLAEVLGESFSGLRVNSRLSARLRATERRLLAAERKEAAAKGAEASRGARAATEQMVLVVDAVVRGLGQRDTRSTAKELADVADDLSLGASQARARTATGPAADARMDAAEVVLRGGQRQLERLGWLGQDLAELTAAGLLRVARTRKAADLLHAELAARDLAVRLRQPDPSFGSRGGGGRGEGDSSGQPGEGEGGGAGKGSGSDGDEGSDADRAFNEAAQELDRLASAHAENMGKVDQALAEGASEEDRKALMEEAKKHADAVREAVRDLPSVGAGSGSWTSKGAASRELAEQMAQSLEQGSPADAVSGGRSAMAALEEARRLASHGGLLRSGPSQALLDEAQRKLGPELRWAEDRLAQMKARAQARAGGDLAKHGAVEGQLSDKATDLQKKGEGALPESALDGLREAARAAREASEALKRGDADRGQTAQRDAQAKLEAARRALGSPSDDSAAELDPRSPDGATPIPKADAHKGPEEFRKRVLRGLGQPAAGRQRDAVTRYAEGLLR